MTTTNGGGRPQDAIASILASMNSGSAGGTIIQAVEDPLAGPGQEVVSVVSGLGGEERTEVVPLNLATSSAGAVQVQGFKRVAAGQSGSLVTKKVIIATINGTQRILTPVSNPQMIAVKSSGGTRLMADPSGGGGTPLTIIQQKPVLQQKPSVIASPGAVSSSAASQAAKSVDNKTCRWKFENGQICGKVFTKTYNLTVHMRMHQDIRPFPCTICEQTFRQKAHLQRHEATHGIDSTQGKKRRKKSLLDGQLEGGGGLLGARRPGARMSESEEEDGEPGTADYRGFDGKRQRVGAGPGGSAVKTEADLDLDPMIEPIDGEAELGRKLCPVTVGTNTEAATGVRHEQFVDELEEDMEPVRYRGGGQQGVTQQVEQGVQYCEADLLPQPATASQFGQQEEKFLPGREVTVQQSSIDAPQVAAMQTQVSMSEFMGEEGAGLGEEEEAVEGKPLKTEMVYTSQGTHYVNESSEFIEQEQDSSAQLLTADGSFIDASSNHLVMSDGGLVSLVGLQEPAGLSEQQDGSSVVNIVTSTATNEQGQQIVIIENLDQHSPELQREIMNALLADHTIVPISQ